MLLSLSEILQLKTHLDKKEPSQKSKNTEKFLVESAFENEKNKLINEIYQLKDLLSNLTVRFFYYSISLKGLFLNKFNLKSQNVNENDSRGDLIKAVADIFQTQKESLLAELRSFITCNINSNEDNKLNFYDKKFNDQVFHYFNKYLLKF